MRYLLVALLLASGLTTSARADSDPTAPLCQDPILAQHWRQILERNAGHPLVRRLIEERETLCRRQAAGGLSALEFRRLWDLALADALLELAGGPESPMAAVRRHPFPVYGTF